jgi:prepilin-type processing-associated H-X9-DG protein/prepilin-type N-terminal cleavage/methylation domain-containing protein
VRFVRRSVWQTTGGFTLVELLVVMAIIGMLVGLTSRVAMSALERGRQAGCASNIRQLALANIAYANEHGSFVPAAADMNGANKQRWHGARTSASKPFEAARGPLIPYLGSSGAGIRACPSMRRYTKTQSANAFEASCGGYGYNSVGVGSQTYLLGMRSEASEMGMRLSQMKKPDSTIMFADAAFAQPYGSNPKYLIEYSFVEPYHWVVQPGVESGMRADPSMHFRHRGRANVAWCDGHVSSEKLDTFAEPHFTRFKLGWFAPSRGWDDGTPDNRFFAP